MDAILAGNAHQSTQVAAREILVPATLEINQQTTLNLLDLAKEVLEMTLIKLVLPVPFFNGSGDFANGKEIERRFDFASVASFSRTSKACHSLARPILNKAIELDSSSDSGRMDDVRTQTDFNNSFAGVEMMRVRSDVVFENGTYDGRTALIHLSTVQSCPFSCLRSLSYYTAYTAQASFSTAALAQQLGTLFDRIRSYLKELELTLDGYTMDNAAARELTLAIAKLHNLKSLSFRHVNGTQVEEQTSPPMEPVNFPKLRYLALEAGSSVSLINAFAHIYLGSVDTLLIRYDNINMYKPILQKPELNPQSQALICRKSIEHMQRFEEDTHVDFRALTRMCDFLDHPTEAAEREKHGPRPHYGLVVTGFQSLLDHRPQLALAKTSRVVICNFGWIGHASTLGDEMKKTTMGTLYDKPSFPNLHIIMLWDVRYSSEWLLFWTRYPEIMDWWAERRSADHGVLLVDRDGEPLGMEWLEVEPEYRLWLRA